MKSWIEGLARPELAGIAPYISDRDAAEGKGLRLADLNENACDLFGNGLNRYPDPQAGGLAKKIAAYCNVPRGNVLVFNGSDEAIDILIRVFCAQGKDSVLVLEPAYSMYRICAEANGVSAIGVRLDGSFQPDVKAILAAVKRSRPKLIFACSPNNPTGNLLDFARLGKIAKKAKAVLVVDEAYAEFAGRSFAGQARRYPNVVVLRTFSKAWALAGARLGYCITSPEIIRLLQKVKLPYNVNSLSLMAALGAFGKIGMVRKCVQETVRERERLGAGLRALGMVAYPSDANFVLFSLPDGVDARQVQKRLAAKYGVLVRDRAGLVPNALRATVCTRKENDYLLQSLLGAAADAVLFDIDGTLVDVSRSYNEAIRETAGRISGKPVQMRVVGQVKRMPGMNNDWDATVEVLRRMGVRSCREEVVPIFQNLYFGRRGEGLMRNEKPLLQAALLRKIGKRVGIVTARPRNEAKIALALLGLPKSTPLVAMEDTAQGKPSPAPLLLAKKMLGARLPVYIGDSADDCEAAARAGCAFVAIGKGKAREREAARYANVNDAIRGLFI
ncbi:MAG: histidinol-phosphate transaminase [Candidatus Micrarchaeota archaeon]|nr:histidinol-phosphate transaminase [Candidatus Micrarchaeota archaeon]